MDSRYILKIKTMGFADGLDMRYKRKRGVKPESKVWNLTKNGPAIY